MTIVDCPNGYVYTEYWKGEGAAVFENVFSRFRYEPNRTRLNVTYHFRGNNRFKQMARKQNDVRLVAERQSRIKENENNYNNKPDNV